MSADSEQGVPASGEAVASAPAAGGARDRLAALVSGRERPTVSCVDELLQVWRHAQQEVGCAYARWRELARGGRDGHAAYVAALDREERAAGVYAAVRSRALARRSDR